MLEKQAVFDLSAKKLGFVNSNCSHSYYPRLLPLPQNNITKNDTQLPIILEKTSRMWIVPTILGGALFIGLIILGMRKCIKKQLLVDRTYQEVTPPEINTAGNPNIEMHDNAKNHIGIDGDEVTLEVEPQ
jgi:hypothetical protein